MFKYFTVFFVTFVVQAAAALTIPEAKRPVVDLVGVLSEKDKSGIESQIFKIHKSGKAQVGVLIIPSLEGEQIESFSIKVAESWKLGSAKEDNGVILVFALNDRKARIEVGQGLEGELTDLDSRRILEEVKNFLRKKQYSTAISFAVKLIDSKIQTENLSPLSNVEVKEKKKTLLNSMSEVVSFVFIFVSFVLFWIAWYFIKESKERELAISTNSQIIKQKIKEAKEIKNTISGKYLSGKEKKLHKLYFEVKNLKKNKNEYQDKKTHLGDN